MLLFNYSLIVITNISPEIIQCWIGNISIQTASLDVCVVCLLFLLFFKCCLSMIVELLPPEGEPAGGVVNECFMLYVICLCCLLFG